MTRRERILLEVAMLAVTVAGGWRVSRAWLDVQRRAEQRLSVLAPLQASARASVLGMAGLALHVDAESLEQGAEQSAVWSVVSASIGAVRLAELLAQRAEASGVELVLVAPEPDTASLGRWKRQTTRVQLTATLEEATRFLDAVTSGTPVIAMEEITLRRLPEPPVGPVMLTVELLLRTWIEPRP